MLLVGVGAVALYVLRRGFPMALLVAALGSATGQRVVRSIGRQARDALARRFGQVDEDESAGKDVVQEASEASFPASDPPSWTPQRI